ncbi:type IV pilin-like G/H family protein [Moorena sp. SIO4G3]|uniref:type IV pilin-like G/H family protein n=1 Tax=Moorena sp. SIO4G3 TaxID=2607821 RepID=UPI00142AA849|nr:type IV pilin-like G/H family protein [Moorena sp. SIO4G3]NEO75679.1 prepilin-type N-terminal cleavage/methylation domain-containing protein [Moorena sp. SIO4G3]
MKTDLKVKLLQHLTQKKQDEGFTLIELLVVIIIIGILSAIALPSFLNQANKAKQSEARTYVGSMNRAQQAYFLENNEFVTDSGDFSELGLGISTRTDNYLYGLKDGGDSPKSVSNYADPRKKGTDQADDKSSLKAYQGITALGQITGSNEATTLAVLCEALDVTQFDGPLGSDVDVNFNADENPECNTGWKDLSSGEKK